MEGEIPWRWSGDAGHEGGGGGPGATGEDAVDIGYGKGPEEDHLQPDEAGEEVRLLGHQVVAENLAIPLLQLHQRRRVEPPGEADLGADQRHRHRQHTGEEHHHDVDEPHSSLSGLSNRRPPKERRGNGNMYVYTTQTSMAKRRDRSCRVTRVSYHGYK
ncbi:hypothetical protein GW17_00003343 [Ensete ventricosum]|nr:hypothetical protein GW17_00003343 [Ensete ventricosum]